MRRPPVAIPVALAWLVAWASGSAPAAALEPTEYEQYLLELVNRARSDPAAEAARLGIGLNQGLPDGTLSPEPKPPLAPSPLLTDAAVGHTEWMLDNDVFSHTGAGGSSPGERIDATGYPWISWGENIAWKGTSAPLSDALVVAFVEENHDNLFTSPGHRVNLLEPAYQELGIGIADGPYAPQGSTLNAVVVTQNFATAFASGPFLTGVVYEDGDQDAFYSVGEGWAGVAVTAVRRSDQRSFETSSGSAGGYSLALPAGTYDVAAGGPGIATQWAWGILVADSNVKVDFQVPEPAAGLQRGVALLLVAVAARGALRRPRGRP